MVGNKINLITSEMPTVLTPWTQSMKLWRWEKDVERGIILPPEMRIIHKEVTANGHHRLELPHRIAMNNRRTYRR